jgi:hypothetical protein
VGRSALVVGVVIASFIGGSLVTGAGAASSDAASASSAATEPLAPAAIGDPSTLVSLAPDRIVDTRQALGGIQGPIAGDVTVDFQVIGVGGVPVEATSVVLNVTAVNPEAQGFFTVFPTGTARPDASNLNFSAGKTVANLVIARIGTGGKVSLYNFGGRADVLFDVTGYFVNGTAAGRFYALIPNRSLDTRINPSTTGAITPVAPGGTATLTLRNQTPTDSHFSAVLVNVTATNATSEGYFTVYPAGSTRPTSSNLNFKAGQTVANAVIAKLGPTAAGGSAITVFNAFGSTDLIIDVFGYFDDGTTPAGASSPSAFRALDQPARVYNTRLGAGPFAGKETRIVNVAGAGGAPAGAVGVVLNATATATTAGSYLSIWRSGLGQPPVSSLNWGPDDTVPNFVGVSVAPSGGTAGQLSIYNDAGSADVLLDVTGYFYPV